LEVTTADFDGIINMIKLGDFQMATVFCDFIKIVGDGETSIPVVKDGAEKFLPDFNTGGRRADQTALLFYSAKKLDGTAEVFINGKKVGTITATPKEGVYSMQSIEVQGSEIKDGVNRISLRNVTHAFTIKNVNLFFHQND
jgi:hypothetical protein